MGRPARPSAARTLAWCTLVGALLGLTGCTATHQAADAGTPGAAHATGGGAATGIPGTSGGTGDGAAVSSSGARGSTPSPSAAPGREQAPGPAAPPVVTLPGLQAAPTAPAAAPLLTGAAPATAERNGAVVAGFPVKVVPVPKGVTVVSSSVSSEGARVQVGMQASSSASPAAVLGAYDEAFGATGFTPTTSPALPGTSAHLYQHGTDGVVVTVKARLGGGTEIALAGSLTTAG
ncbi:hypothetical protein [Cellulomonas sp. SG140]|uniref:hypothetical protein n=1 Tax=Cellulomonas sp. SG140 TaxID=2976536 RepID=UPI0021E804C9|nr:hypothetical protein [Cellulomonas sp. SG140]